MKERTIKAIDGVVLCQYAYDNETNTDYVNFYVENGLGGNFPYTFVGESQIMKDFESYTDSELEGLYYESVNIVA